MNVARNAPCPCGSGQKYKACCAGKTALRQPRQWNRTLIIAAAAVLLLVAGLSVLRPRSADGAPGPAPPGKVWSAEHGHWHDAP